MKKTVTKKLKETTVNDINALRAFVMPELFPFLLEAYTKESKDEAALLEDIKSARAKYKELVTASKQK